VSDDIGERVDLGAPATARAPDPSAPFSTKGTTLRLDVAAVDRGAARDGSSINQPIQQLEPETLAATSD